MAIYNKVERLHNIRRKLEELIAKKCDQELIICYQDVIDHLEADIVTWELMVELGFIQAEPTVCTTDCQATVAMLWQTQRVISVEKIFDWLRFKNFWKVTFYFIIK